MNTFSLIAAWVALFYCHMAAGIMVIRWLDKVCQDTPCTVSQLWFFSAIWPVVIGCFALGAVLDCLWRLLRFICKPLAFLAEKTKPK